MPQGTPGNDYYKKRKLPARRAHLSPAQRAMEAAELLHRGARTHMAKAVLSQTRVPAYLKLEPRGVFLGPGLCGSGPKQSLNRMPITLDVSKVTCRSCKKRIKQRGSKVLVRAWRPISAELATEIRELFEAGRSPWQIARVVGVTPFIVRQVLIEAGHPTHGKLSAGSAQLVRGAAERLAQLDVPLIQTHRVAAAMFMASQRDEVELMQAFEELCEAEGVKSWSYPNWWAEHCP